MTQQNNEFEKWYVKNITHTDEVYFGKNEAGAYVCEGIEISFKTRQAATAEADKRIAELKAEIVKLNAENKQIDAINASLQDHINDLRNDLNEIIEWCAGYSEQHTHIPLHLREINNIAKDALVYPLQQSLIQHDNEVIDKVIRIIDAYGLENGKSIIETIRALKGK